ncbi:MAG: alpha-glucan family phosphorylase [Fimbriimonadaceae bacterium]
MKHIRYTHSFEVVFELPEPLKPLGRLAANFRWTWHHPTRDVFREADRQLWDDVGHNPMQLIASLSPERIEKLVNDPVFLARLRSCEADLDEYLQSRTWFEERYPDQVGKLSVAYFCAEFGVSECLPIYSGGLGVLAGDHLKAASDLGIPLVGVGLLYARGYFRQFLNPDGWQQEIYPNYDFHQMPLKLVRGPDDQPVRVEVEFPDRTVTCQVWRADVGRVPIFLLDSNVLENAPSDQTITDTLYGGDSEMRIRQEMILGIGGLKALRALGIRPTVCHMNEGHAAFMSIERIRQFMEENQCDFRTARQVVVNGNVFTTHTPVPAGFDFFTPDLLERYMGANIGAVKLPFPDFVKLGRIDEDNPAEAFNMAVLAMEMSNHVNGVSKLHAAVTRSMFQARWPGYPEDEVPVEAITNGVHTCTWVCRRMSDLFDRYLEGDWRRRCDDPEIWQGVYRIPDSELWEALENQRGDLVRYIRKRLQVDLKRRNAGRLDIGLVNNILDPRILTIGFARRFATYKRGNLMLHDRERLKELLFHTERPIQIVIAGKAHPRDDAGKRIIQELVHFINHEGARARMVFLEDYDMQLARALVQGVDVWLNNPRRPMEASGTSGMKVLMNGGLNCSVLDGWWDEGYTPGVGWAIGDRIDVPDEAQQDWLDSRSLYRAIEQEIAPRFYHRVDGGVPTSWIEMVKRSIAELVPRFSTSRMVREYTEKFYIPASDAFLRLQEDGLSRARAALAWRDRVRSAWPNVRIAGVRDTASANNPLGASFTITVDANLGALTPDDVQVEAMVGRVSGGRELTDVVRYALDFVEKDGPVSRFCGTVTCHEPGHMGYATRIVPKHPDVNVRSELPLVCWEPR